MKSYFVHKEPVLDANRRTFGQELVFREPRPDADSPWSPVRVDEETMHAPGDDGLTRFVGNKRCFLSVEATVLRTDALFSFPRNCIFLVSNKDSLDKEVLLQSGVLRKKGYQIGAEEGRPSPLHQIADFVRIDTVGLDGPGVASAFAQFKGLQARKIARGVRTAEAYQDARSAGFDLFQGTFYLDPATRPPEPVSDSQIQLMKLSEDLRSNRDVSVIERSFKDSPKLTYGLLQLINSAFFGVSVKVVSIRQAITLLGYDRLLKWVVLLLYGINPGSEQANPVIEKAVVRGRVMETLARQIGHSQEADSAFITGMLSLFPLLFDIHLSDLATEMKLGQEIRSAIITREGFLGTLLNLAEKVDFQDFAAVGDELSELQLSMADLLSAETDAIIDSQSRLFA